MLARLRAMVTRLQVKVVAARTMIADLRVKVLRKRIKLARKQVMFARQRIKLARKRIKLARQRVLFADERAKVSRVRIFTILRLSINVYTSQTTPAGIESDKDDSTDDANQAR